MSVKNIPFASDLHKQTLDRLKARLKLSRDEMSKKYADWTRSEEDSLAYLPETEGDSLRKQARKSGTPQYTTLVLPYSYSILLAAHTYWTSVFLARNPVMQFSARHGEPEMNVMAMEALMDYQVNVGKMMVPLYIWLLDAGKYGLGVVGNYWAEESAVVSEIVERPRTYLGLPIPGAKPTKVRETRNIPGYVGNKIYNVRPQDFFPDPRVPIAHLQQGEFCGRYVEVGWNTILRRQSEEIYFNVDVLKKRRMTMRTQDREMGSTQMELPDITQQVSARVDPEDMGFVALHEMYVELVPKDWGLGETSYPEKWVFTMADEAVIISAQPFGMYHNQFPFNVLEYEIEGYSTLKRSMLDVINPLNNVMTWLVNTHFQNVRKVLNDQLVVDPSRVVMKDLMDPLPGRLIRLKPSAYGTDPALSIHQLQVSDVTRTHINDLSVIMDMVQRVTGVNDNIMGAIGAGGRKTATEVRTSSSFGVNRLKTNSEYMSAMGFSPLAQVLVQNTQQKYDMDRMFKIAGSMINPTRSFLQVTAESISGFFDFVPVDGTMPVDRFAQATLMKEIMAEMGANPQLGMQYDLGAMLGYTVQLAGIKNLDQFKVKVMPDEQVRQGAQAGNLIPMGGGGGRARSSSRSEYGSGPVPGAGQISGMGPSG